MANVIFDDDVADVLEAGWVIVPGCGVAFVCELTAARHKVTKVDVKMKSAVCKQAHSGLIDLVLAVLVHN